VEMPANLPPQYFEAEKVYRQAKTPEEKVEALETILAIMPKHKGTDKLRAELRTRIAKFTQEAQRRPTLARKGSAYNIRKEGAGQVALVGLPNSGKSQLVSSLTEAITEVADYPYSTKMPVPGMMRFENIQIQLLDMPPITDRDAKPWFSHLLRNADILMIVMDLADDPSMQLEAILQELETMKVKIGTAGAGDELLPGVARKKAVLVGTKLDLDGSGERWAAFKSRWGSQLPLVAVAARVGRGLEEMKRVVFDAFDIIRVYTKTPGKNPDLEDPVILKKGCTVEDAATSVHKDIARRLKYAQVWGSGKFDGQRVKRGHVLEDGDIVELHA
jgi:ribosome-interacting GTPase 1